jgi:hypothetical protein
MTDKVFLMCIYQFMSFAGMRKISYQEMTSRKSCFIPFRAGEGSDGHGVVNVATTRIL